MAIRTVILVLLAINILSTNAHALTAAARMHKILNQHAMTSQAPEIRHGFSVDVDVARGNSASQRDPGSTAYQTTMIRYSIPLSGRSAQERECRLSWGDHARVVATAAVWSLSNRLLRGDADIGGALPGGATLWGHAVPWMFAASLHREMGYGEAALAAGLDMVSEQMAGWSAALDMGLSSELPADHWAYNPGNRWEDQAQMTMHLYRARAASTALLAHNHGGADWTLKVAPVIGGAGYQAGRWLGESGVTPGWDDESFEGKLWGARPYNVGELAAGAAAGVGVSRTVQCGD